MTINYRLIWLAFVCPIQYRKRLDNYLTLILLLSYRLEWLLAQILFQFQEFSILNTRWILFICFVFSSLPWLFQILLIRSWRTWLLTLFITEFLLDFEFWSMFSQFDLLITFDRLIWALLSLWLFELFLVHTCWSFRYFITFFIGTQIITCNLTFTLFICNVLVVKWFLFLLLFATFIIFSLVYILFILILIIWGTHLINLLFELLHNLPLFNHLDMHFL